MLGFLARRVEDGPMRVGEVGRRLQQQGGLADARLAAKQHQRTGDDAAAEHTIEFADTRSNAIGLRCFNFCVLLRARRRPWHRIAMRGRAAHHAFERALLDKRAPCAAVVALALPLGPLDTALLTHEHWLRCLHDEAFRGHGEVRRTRRVNCTVTIVSSSSAPCSPYSSVFSEVTGRL